MTFMLASGLFVLIFESSGVVAAKTIPAGEMITPDVLASEDGSFAEPEADLFSREASRTIYAEQAVTLENTRPHRVIERNQILPITYRVDGLEIRISGRAMGAAAIGENVRVMNTNTRQMLTGVAQEDGSVTIK